MKSGGPTVPNLPVVSNGTEQGEVPAIDGFELVILPAGRVKRET